MVDAVTAVHFTVLGPPVAWQRAATRGGQRFTPAKTREYQRLVQFSILRDVPQSTRAAWLADKPHLIAVMVAHVPPSSRADLDNLQKTIGDAAQTVLLANDRQIVEWHALRVVDREAPRVEVVIGVRTLVEVWSVEQMAALVGADLAVLAPKKRRRAT